MSGHYNNRPKDDFTKIQLSEISDFTELFEQSLPGDYFQEHGDPQTAFGPSSPPVKDGSLMEATLQGPVFS